MEDMVLKTMGYLLFAGLYYLFRVLCPMKKKKVFCIMTHDGGRDGNVGRMVDYLHNRQEGYRFAYLRRSEESRTLFFFLTKPYHLATSEYVLMDNTFLPMAYIRFRRRVRVIQLWHGTGTVKQFGQDVNTGRLKELEKKANSRITHLIVNSEKTRKQYAKAFGVSPDKVFVNGLPRTDLFFDEKQREERIQRFYQQYPKLKEKKLFLYAPTFRDSQREHPQLMLDTAAWCEGLPEDYALLLRLHPFVAKAYEREQERKEQPFGNRVMQMSSYPDVNTLLLVSDCLITDYSSIIYEYCLLGRPMIFYAYDLESFEKQGRGFYGPYKEYVPGPVASSTQEVIKLARNMKPDAAVISRFRDENYAFQDGKSAERLYHLVFHS